MSPEAAEQCGEVIGGHGIGTGEQDPLRLASVARHGRVSNGGVESMSVEPNARDRPVGVGQPAPDSGAADSRSLAGVVPADGRWLMAAAVLAGVFVGQSLFAATRWSLCNDEAKHLVTGWYALRGDCCRGIDNTPGTAVWALPIVAAGYPPPDGLPGGDAHELGHSWLCRSPLLDPLLFRARCLTIGAGLVMAGPTAAAITAFLIAFDPNLVAHFSLVSPDALLAAAVVGGVIACERWIRTPSIARGAVMGLAVGAAVVAKLSGLLLVPAVAIIGSGAAILKSAANGWRLPPRTAGTVAGSITAACLVAGAVVWAAYGCHLTSDLPFVGLPGFLAGLEGSRRMAREGMVTFFCGAVGQHFPGYFFAVLGLKTPLAVLAAWGLGAAAAARRGVPPLAAIAAVTAGVFFGVAAASRLNIGVRHILPVYPLLAIATGVLLGPLLRRPTSAAAAASVASRAARRWSLGAVVLAAWLAADTAVTAPHYLSYFNQFVRGPADRVRYLGDSNVDWGQDLKHLKATLDRLGLDEVLLAYFGNTDPGHYRIRYQNVPGTLFAESAGDHVVSDRREVLAVSVMNLQGTFLLDPGSFRWLLDREPLAVAGRSIYLYDITGDAEAHARLVPLYEQYGLPGLAEAERRKAIRYALER
jgi:hypothetical protein